MVTEKFIVCDNIDQCQSIIDEISKKLLVKLGSSTIWDNPRFIINHSGNADEIFYVPWLWNTHPYKFCTICPENDILPALPAYAKIVEGEINGK